MTTQMGTNNQRTHHRITQTEMPGEWRKSRRIQVGYPGWYTSWAGTQTEASVLRLQELPGHRPAERKTYGLGEQEKHIDEMRHLRTYRKGGTDEYAQTEDLKQRGR